MDQLINFPLVEPSEVAQLRADHEAAPGDDTAAVALGLALAKLGCTYEAAHLLRPHRTSWKGSNDETTAKAALDAQTWWNKNWREFAQLKQAGKRDEALNLLGDRAPDFWDLPSLLLHLGGFAAETGRLELAEHLFRRVAGLAKRDLPKMEMAAFDYVAQSSLIDVLALRGDAKGALAAYRTLTPNQGNVMAHQLQGARLLVAAGRDDEAMVAVAEITVTAENERKGYSREIRLDFVDKDSVLQNLRGHPDWPAMRADPAAFLKGRSAAGS